MYLINDTYFTAPKREIPNLNEADSRSFAELEMLIDEKCRLLMLDFLTVDEFQELDSYLDNGMFPEDAQPNPLLPDYVPQKWIDLVNGVTYPKNGVNLIWNGLIYEKGTYKGSVLADYVYYHWHTENVSYMTGVGDSKGNPKGASLVFPTQRVTKAWNDFVKAYQDCLSSYRGSLYGNYYRAGGYWNYLENQEVSLLQFLSDHSDDYTSTNRKFFSIKNQLGI